MVCNLTCGSVLPAVCARLTGNGSSFMTTYQRLPISRAVKRCLTSNLDGRGSVGEALIGHLESG